MTGDRRDLSCHLIRQRTHRSHTPPANPSSHTHFVTSVHKSVNILTAARTHTHTLAPSRSSFFSELPYPLVLLSLPQHGLFLLQARLPPPLLPSRTYLCLSSTRHHFTTHRLLFHPLGFFSSPHGLYIVEAGPRREQERLFIYQQSGNESSCHQGRAHICSHP